MKRFVGLILIYFSIFDAFLYNLMDKDIILELTGINFFDLPLILLLKSIGVKLSRVFSQLTVSRSNFLFIRCFLTDWVTVSTSGSSGMLYITPSSL